jgi:hypothetical protein
MLRDLQRVAERDTDLGAEPFKAAAARLLRDQFLLRERVGDREALRLVSNHYDYFESLFDALGWSLRRDDDFGVIGILPGEGQTRARLRLLDTLIVLCLRLLYEEGFDRFEVRDGCVFTESQTLIERYESLFTGRSLPPKTELRDLLARLRRQRLIDIGENDEQGLPRLRILPTIRWVTGPAVLERVGAFAGQPDDEGADQAGDESSGDEAGEEQET